MSSITAGDGSSGGGGVGGRPPPLASPYNKRPSSQGPSPTSSQSQSRPPSSHLPPPHPHSATQPSPFDPQMYHHLMQQQVHHPSMVPPSFNTTTPTVLDMLWPHNSFAPRFSMSSLHYERAYYEQKRRELELAHERDNQTIRIER